MILFFTKLKVVFERFFTSHFIITLPLSARALLQERLWSDTTAGHIRCCGYAIRLVFAVWLCWRHKNVLLNVYYLLDDIVSSVETNTERDVPIQKSVTLSLTIDGYISSNIFSCLFVFFFRNSAIFSCFIFRCILMSWIYHKKFFQ